MPPAVTNDPVVVLVLCVVNNNELVPAAAEPIFIVPVVNPVNRFTVPVVTPDDRLAVPFEVLFIFTSFPVINPPTLSVVVAELLEPILTFPLNDKFVVVAEPNKLPVVAFVLNTLAVVLVVVILGLAPFILNVVALVPVIVALPIVNVPVAAPIPITVAAPAKLTVVATVLYRFCVVCVPITVGLPIVSVPLIPPIANVVAAPAKLTVEAIPLIKLKVVLDVVKLVVISGLVPNTKTPLPVSSLITPASSADVVAENTLSLFLV